MDAGVIIFTCKAAARGVDIKLLNAAFIIMLYRPNETSEVDQALTRTARNIGQVSKGEYHFLKSNDKECMENDEMHGCEEGSGKSRYESLKFTDG